MRTAVEMESDYRLWAAAPANVARTVTTVVELIGGSVTVNVTVGRSQNAWTRGAHRTRTHNEYW